MLIPTQITFHGMSHSDPLEADIRERVAGLEQFYGRIVGCRVLTEVPHRHRRGGRHVHVRIELTVPGSPPIVVTHEPSLHGPSKDVGAAAHHKATELDAEQQYAHVAIRQAFEVARRRLQDFAREERHAVRIHAE